VNGRLDETWVAAQNNQGGAGPRRFIILLLLSGLHDLLTSNSSPEARSLSPIPTTLSIAWVQRKPGAIKTGGVATPSVLGDWGKKRAQLERLDESMQGLFDVKVRYASPEKPLSLIDGPVFDRLVRNEVRRRPANDVRRHQGRSRSTRWWFSRTKTSFRGWRAASRTEKPRCSPRSGDDFPVGEVHPNFLGFNYLKEGVGKPGSFPVKTGNPERALLVLGIRGPHEKISARLGPVI